MSLQPGPDDHKDDSSLTPPAGGPPEGPTPQDVGAEGPGGPPPAGPPQAGPPSDAGPPPVAPQPPPWQAAPPPAAPGWGAPPPADQPYAPPPPGAYGGPPPDYPPPGYPPAGYQAVGYGQPAQTDSKAIIGLVLAISSWVVCPVITAIIALVVAGQSNQAIDASGGRLEGRSLNTATKVIAWINIAVSILALVGFIVLLAVGWSIDSSMVSDTQGF